MGERIDLRLVAHLGAVWLIGGVMLPTAGGAVVVSLFVGAAAAAVMALVVLGLTLLLFWAVIKLTAPVSRLGGTAGARAGWVALVLACGSVLWWQGWGLSDAAGLGISRRPELTALFGGLAFAVVAGMLVRSLWVNAASAAVLVVLAVVGMAALRSSGPSDLDARLAHAQVQRDLTYVVEIPGYAPSDRAYGDRLGAGSFLPADPKAIPELQYVNVRGYDAGWHRVPGSPDCGETVYDSPLSTAACEREPEGMVYRLGISEHGYDVRVGDATVVVAGSLAVDRALLRDAARSARPGDPADLEGMPDAEPFYVVDLPGFRAQPMGSPTGTQYLRADHASGPQSVHVALYVVPPGNGDDCFMSTCEPEGPNLTYLRRDDVHGYVHHREDVILTVQGGVSVDRAVLRAAALAARPASDDELLRALPPPQPRDRWDRLRTWLRSH